MHKKSPGSHCEPRLGETGAVAGQLSAGHSFLLLVFAFVHDVPVLPERHFSFSAVDREWMWWVISLEVQASALMARKRILRYRISNL